MKNQKGISLIALIITIVVMLILAGVSLRLGIGDNGIIQNTQNAKEKSIESESKEYIMEAWGYILANVKDNQMPYSDAVSSRSAHSVASKMLPKYLTSYGTGSLESDDAGNYVVNISVDGRNVSAYKVKFKLKGNDQENYFYIVNDNQIYSEKDIN